MGWGVAWNLKPDASLPITSGTPSLPRFPSSLDGTEKQVRRGRVPKTGEGGGEGVCKCGARVHQPSESESESFPHHHTGNHTPPSFPTLHTDLPIPTLVSQTHSELVHSGQKSEAAARPEVCFKKNTPHPMEGREGVHSPIGYFLEPLVQSASYPPSQKHNGAPINAPFGMKLKHIRAKLI